MRTSLYADQELRRLTLAWAIKLRVNPKTIRIREMRRQWGSCSSTGILTLASDLTAQPVSFQRYVVVHELLHLRYRTHGRMFKALLSAHVPGWQHLERNRLERPLKSDIPKRVSARRGNRL